MFLPWNQVIIGLIVCIAFYAYTITFIGYYKKAYKVRARYKKVNKSLKEQQKKFEKIAADLRAQGNKKEKSMETKATQLEDKLNEFIPIITPKFQEIHASLKQAGLSPETGWDENQQAMPLVQRYLKIEKIQHIQQLALERLVTLRQDVPNIKVLLKKMEERIAGETTL